MIGLYRQRHSRAVGIYVTHLFSADYDENQALSLSLVCSKFRGH
jgi:hypothetical protein